MRDLPVYEAPVEIVIQRLRLACRRCGPKLERLNWLAPYTRVTARLAASVVRLCKVMIDRCAMLPTSNGTVLDHGQAE